MRMRNLALVLSLLAGITAAQAQTPPRGGPTPAPAGAAVYFINLKDGARLPRSFTVQFGLRNMGLASAGTENGASGHHHLLIDVGLPALNEPIPSDFNHLHFGSGQSEAEISLPPGEHTLQLLFADKDHVPHATPLYSERIRVTVLEGPVAASAAPAAAAPVAAPERETKPRPLAPKRERRRARPRDDDEWDW